MESIQQFNKLLKNKIMNNQFNYIEPIKTELEKGLHEISKMFCLIGTPNETPRYFNFGGADIETNKIKIKSTQVDIWFEVVAPYNVEYVLCDCTIFWEQFKQFRNEFLQKNYPTIDLY